MGSEMNLIRKDLERIKSELSFIKEFLLDDEAGLEVSDEVVKEVEESRRKGDEDLVSHDEVFKRYCK